MSKAGLDQKVGRRSFIKGAAAAAGGLAFTNWALTNADAVAQDGQAYVIVSDVLRGGGGEPQLGPGCAESSVFVTGEEVVWRAVVFNAQTGEIINSPEDVAAHGLTMEVFLEGQDAPFEMSHGIHPPNADAADQIYYWSESWDVPGDFAGKFKYTITVNGNEGTGLMEILGVPGVDTFPSALSMNE